MFTLSVAENPSYNDAFRGLTQFNSGAATQGVQMQIAFTGMVTGESITCTATVSGANTAPLLVSPAGGVVTSTANNLVLEWADTGITGFATSDAFTASCVFSAGSLTNIAPGSITATAGLWPAGGAFGTGTGGSPLILSTAATGQIPRYAGPTTSAVAVVNVVSPGPIKAKIRAGQITSQ